MASRTKPYESFGPYILFKKLEADALGDLWRAGRIDAGQLGPTLAVRRLTGGSREALIATAHAASEIVPQLAGTSFARDQVVGVADNTPFVAWDYQGGRSLRYIIDRARGGNGVSPNPLPLDQAIVIAEKVALSLATTADLKDGAGQRLWHGALLPQFVWISDDGEIRVAGQLLGAGIMASLHDPKVYGEVSRYFPPEARTVTQPRNTDVYSLGALLFLLVTGQEPPDAATASAFGSAVRAAKTTTGASIPDDIRVILDKSFQLDPAMRYQSIADLKQAISALAHGGKYSGTTFNLAFYLSNLLKKEMEAEAVDREKEAKVNVAPYLEAPKTAAPVAAAPAPVAAPFATHNETAPPAKSKLPLALAAGLVVAAGLGAGGWYMLKKNAAAAPAQQTTNAQVVPTAVAPKPLALPEPIVASGGSTDTAAPAATDSAAQQKAFEDAVRQKVQAEMMKLQDEFLTELKKSQPKNVPVAPPQQVSASTQQDERPSISAAQLDQQRRDAQPQAVATTQTIAPAPSPTPQQTQTVAPVQQQVQPQVAQTQTAAPVQQLPTVREGDVVAVGELDVVPRPVRVVTPIYPPMARAQRLAASVILSVFVNEVGQVTDVRVLRGEPRFGINDAAIRALKATRFSSPMKAGKRVKTWVPQQIEFKP
jgi:TonB family protein